VKICAIFSAPVGCHGLQFCCSSARAVRNGQVSTIVLRIS
jgi:hypothetical protein